jgi:plasmid maintenance system antidote protein VapI
MADFGVSINRVVRDLRVRKKGLARSSMSGAPSLRILRFGWDATGTTAEFWINLQSTYDLHRARNAMPQIEVDVRPIATA